VLVIAVPAGGLLATAALTASAHRSTPRLATQLAATTPACAPAGEPKEFEVTFRYIVQDRRTVRQPRQNRPFTVGYSVKTAAQIRLTIRRSGKTFFAYPKAGTIRKAGELDIRVPRLRHGRYRQTMQAYSARKNQTLCPSRTLVVRR